MAQACAVAARYWLGEAWVSKAAIMAVSEHPVAVIAVIIT